MPRARRVFHGLAVPPVMLDKTWHGVGLGRRHEPARDRSTAPFIGPSVSLSKSCIARESQVLEQGPSYLMSFGTGGIYLNETLAVAAQHEPGSLLGKDSGARARSGCVSGA